MSLFVDECRKLIEPEDIFELLPKTILIELLKGFYYTSGHDIAIHWAEFDSELLKWAIEPKSLISAHSAKEKNECFLLCDVCNKIRSKIGLENCSHISSAIAQEYVDNIRTKPGKYKCWAGIWKQTYPLFFGGNVRAILLAGGRVFSSEKKLSEELKEKIMGLEEDAKVWSTLKTRYSTWSNLWYDMTGHFENEIESQAMRSPQATLGLSSKRFNDLGYSLQLVLDRLYETKFGQAIQLAQEHLKEIRLNVSLCDRATWWEGTKNLLSDLFLGMKLENLIIYQRRNSMYERAENCSIGYSEQSRLSAKDIMAKIPSDQLSEVESNWNLNLPNSICWSYRSDQKLDKTRLSTLVLFGGDICGSYHRFVEEICKLVTRNLDIVTMAFILNETKAKHERQVGFLAHSIRNPLKNITFELNKLMSLPFVSNEPALLKKLKIIDKHLNVAKFDIYDMIKGSDKTGDILCQEMLRRVKKNLQVEAREKNCRLIERGNWSRPLFIEGNTTKLNIAFTNLINNAIKYSFFKHDILIYLGISEGDTLEIIIRNYGIGIPPKYLQEVRNYHIRANIIDLKQPFREGFGLGLPIAIEMIERYGGFLKIDSWPADDGLRAASQEYHRYLTEVNVKMPLKKHVT